jgi:hypothetical protein
MTHLEPTDAGDPAAPDPVTIGTAVVAYIEPYAGRARAFNAWYERDHYYAAAMAGPGMYAGARWVATRACKAARPSRSLLGDPERGSYLATYWVLPGRQTEWDEWVVREYDNMPPERLFRDRDHLHTGVYRFVGDARAPNAPPPATALDHGFAGVLVLVSTSGEQEATTGLLGEGIPLVLTFASERTIMTTTDPGEHRLTLAFCRDDPLGAWARVAERVEAQPGIGFASPFLATVPGTDTHVDEL